MKKIIGILIFVAVPISTILGIISPLTGFNATGSSNYWQILAFIAPSISYAISVNCFDKKRIIAIINPIYWITGPFITANAYGISLNKSLNNLLASRYLIIQSLFNIYILADSLRPFLVLHQKANSVVELLVFAVILEFYVYLNFSGYSMLAGIFLKSCGVPTVKNFKKPFQSATLMEFWSRWHCSFGIILKEIFYGITKIYVINIIIVFIMSALWHGVTLNFVAWGAFHALMFIIANKVKLIRSKAINLIILYFTIIVGRAIFSSFNFVQITNIWGMSELFNVYSSISLFKILGGMLAILYIFKEILCLKISRKVKEFVSYGLAISLLILSDFSTSSFYGMR